MAYPGGGWEAAASLPKLKKNAVENLYLQQFLQKYVCWNCITMGKNHVRTITQKI